MYDNLQHHQNEKQLGDMDHTFNIKMSIVDKDMSRLDNKIDKEMANLLATYERYRNDIMKYSAGK